MSILDICYYLLFFIAKQLCLLTFHVLLRIVNSALTRQLYKHVHPQSSPRPSASLCPCLLFYTDTSNGIKALWWDESDSAVAVSKHVCLKVYVPAHMRVRARVRARVCLWVHTSSC